jgi:SAM-dependent methyltransferase
MDRSHFEVVADVDQRHWWFLGRRKLLRDVLRCVVSPDPAALVIDVGCGTGANIASLAGDYRCLGIDTSADAIDFARQRFPHVQFICGAAPGDLGATASQARGMLLMDVLEHVEDDRGVLAPLAQSLAPGAILLLTVPADMRLWSAHDEGLLHFRRYDEAMLRRLWHGLPLEPMAVSHFCTRLYPLARLQRGMSGLRDRLLRRPRGDAWSMRVPAAPLNRLLERTFRSEARTLVDLTQGRRNAGYRYGVSMMAVLRRVSDQPRSSRHGVNGHT